MLKRSLRSLVPLLLIGALGPSLLRGQSEEALAQFFEGRTVVMKMDMPANKDGVDVFPGRQPETNFSEYSQRLKRFGISLHSGDATPVTKIKVKDKLIEFQLGGGGYGTAGDDKGTGVAFTPSSKSGREKDLERDIKKVTDPQQKHRMQDELNDLRQRREREDARLRSVASLDQEQRQQLIAQRALQAGSRFNLHYPQGVGLESLTPDVVMQALAQYLDFAAPAPGPATPQPPVAAAIPAAAPGEMRKGMLENEVDALMGRPIEVHRSKEGSLEVSHSTYQKGENSVDALFVEGVLVRYIISSK
jgi:hypothetical protein